MSDGDDLPEADRAAGAPHPRHTVQLFGQDAAEAAFLDATREGRRHHAWLVTGARGVGKATLAWRIARHLRAGQDDGPGLFGEATAPATLDIPPEHPVARRMAALSDPGTLLIRRAWDADRKRLKAQITVDEVRKLNGFFGLSATDDGTRVVIVDSADEMNTSAANAILKVLEEPPQNAVLLLVSHQPSRLLPTIRSRCRTLACKTLGPEDMALALANAGFDAGDQGPALAVPAPCAAGRVGPGPRTGTGRLRGVRWGRSSRAGRRLGGRSDPASERRRAGHLCRNRRLAGRCSATGPAQGDSPSTWRLGPGARRTTGTGRSVGRAGTWRSGRRRRR